MTFLLLLALDWHENKYGNQHPVYLNPSAIIEMEDKRYNTICEGPSYENCKSEQRVCEITLGFTKYGAIKEAVKGRCSNIMLKIEDKEWGK